MSSDEKVNRVDPAEIRAALQRVLASRALTGAERCRWLLERIVTLCLDGALDQISEKCLASDLHGGPEQFTVAGSSRIRTAVNRLRSRLDQYYREEGPADPVVIEIPKGAYVPLFQRGGVSRADGSAQPADGIQSPSFVARQLYLEGRLHLQRGAGSEVQRAMELFERSFALDPTLSPALSGAADCWVTLSIFGHISGREALREASPRVNRALRLNRHAAENWATHGLVSALLEWRWERSVLDFERALRLDPSSSAIRRQYSSFCLLAIGRTEQALKVSCESMELAPNAARPNLHYAIALYANRDYEQARRQCERTLEFSPVASSLLLWLGRILCGMGRYGEALKSFEKAWELERNVSFLGHMGLALALSGQTGEAHRVLRECAQQAERGFVPDYLFASIQFGLGEFEHCFDWLDRGADNLDPWVALIMSSDPLFAELRAMPRGIALRKRMNLPARIE